MQYLRLQQGLEMGVAHHIVPYTTEKSQSHRGVVPTSQSHHRILPKSQEISSLEVDHSHLYYCTKNELSISQCS